jgi:hypothetical protein
MSTFWSLQVEFRYFGLRQRNVGSTDFKSASTESEEGKDVKRDRLASLINTFQLMNLFREPINFLPTLPLLLEREREKGEKVEQMISLLLIEKNWTGSSELILHFFQGSDVGYLLAAAASKVARWHIFKQIILIWVNFGGLWNGKGCYVYSLAIWNMVLPFGTLYGHFVHSTSIWYILRILVYSTYFGILCQE